jgi:hypothetical protein
VGCCGRGLFGIEEGAPVEIDPAERKRKQAASGEATRKILSCNMADPSTISFFKKAVCLCCCSASGAHARKRGAGFCRQQGSTRWAGAFGRRICTWTADSCVAALTWRVCVPAGTRLQKSYRAWLGLGDQADAGGSGQAVPRAGSSAGLDPVSCLLFAHPAAGNDLLGCLAGLQNAFKDLAITGGRCAAVVAAEDPAADSCWMDPSNLPMRPLQVTSSVATLQSACCLQVVCPLD